MNIGIIGYRGTGKTSVAKLLAEKLGLDYFSVDDEIVSSEGRSINEIVNKHLRKSFHKGALILYI